MIRLFDERSIRTIALALGIAAMAMAVLTGAGASLESAARGVRASLRSHPASSQVVIVEIDAHSLARLNRWPWPRRLYAAAVDRLEAAGVRSIAFDVDVSSASQAGDDALFAAALRRAGGSVILPTFRQDASAHSTDWIDSLPIPILRTNAFVAGVNVFPDRDGIVRNYPLGIETRGQPRPSIAAMVAEISAASGRTFPIDYAIDANSIDRISFADLVQGRVSRARLAGKRVLIGATAIELGDRYPVPGGGIVPGVVVQALAAETLIQSGVVVALGVLPAIVLTVLVLAAAMRFRNRFAWVATGIGLALLLPLAPIPFETAGYQFNVAPALLGAATAAAAGLVLMVFNELQRRRFFDRGSGLANGAALEAAALSYPSVEITVARFDRLTEMTAALGAKVSGDALLQMAKRLTTELDTTIYHIDAGALAWLAHDRGSVAADQDTDEDDRFIRLLAALRGSVRMEDVALDVRPTFGITCGDGRSAANLVAGALVAARRARATGGMWDRFLSSDGDAQRLRLTLLGEFSDALAGGDIWVAYQPKFDLRQGRVRGCEALIRWRHPTRGAIPPDHFIPLVEEDGLAFDLTRFVLDRALADLTVWHREDPGICVAVNLSATLLHDPALVGMVESALAAHDVPAAWLTLELTESAIIADANAATTALAQLQALGVKLSIDDYGTGQSTLSYLRRVPADELKIDKSFVQGIVGSASDRLLVRSTVELAHALGMAVVAEGVEDASCLAMLVELGCDTVQGWHTGRPLPANAFLDLLSTPIRAAA